MQQSQGEKKKLLGKAAATVPPGFTAGNTAFHRAGMQAAGILFNNYKELTTIPSEV